MKSNTWGKYLESEGVISYLEEKTKWHVRIGQVHRKSWLLNITRQKTGRRTKGANVMSKSVLRSVKVAEAVSYLALQERCSSAPACRETRCSVSTSSTRSGGTGEQKLLSLAWLSYFFSKTGGGRGLLYKHHRNSLISDLLSVPLINWCYPV